MHGRKFSWSNEREVPTLTKIDRAYVSVDWELDHLDSLLQALSTDSSNHCPLYLLLEERMDTKRRFRFEPFWTKLEVFLEVVQEALICDPLIVEPFHRLDVLLRNTARALTSWGQRKIGNIKLQIRVARLVILRLDAA